MLSLSVTKLLSVCKDSLCTRMAERVGDNCARVPRDQGPVLALALLVGEGCQD